jgi:hypothetical protein
MLACCTLLKAVQALRIFKRNKKPLETKIDSCLPALHEWTLLQRDDLPDGADRLEPCSCTLFSLLPEEHGVEGKEEGKEAYRYGRDKASGEGYLHMSSDRYRHEGTPFYIRFLPEISINTMIFVRKVLNTCTNRPVILVDGGPWYPRALQKYGLKRLHITFGERNSIERLFRTFKERTRRFYNNIPSKLVEERELLHTAVYALV